ncbi:MAG: hypothetical protein OQJ99_01800 [Rhodospirillales bacterium]|nr:hypothetical protein [Rhodospirillales bacterium]MCW8861291.1 hypothetical protein [Rhodospirillales bacterium]MCW9001889.1 hypothetical protein [Rhodospirillales bacterium]MCW9039234.1 hypothetical protein [Rhodospirillales bacterium]
MNSLPNDNRTIFHVGLHNRDVRALVKENQSHSFINDCWADVRYQEVLADDEEMARTIIVSRFPPEDGFVIDEVRMA